MCVERTFLYYTSSGLFGLCLRWFSLLLVVRPLLLLLLLLLLPLLLLLLLLLLLDSTTYTGKQKPCLTKSQLVKAGWR